MRTEIDQDQLRLTMLEMYRIKQGELLSGLVHLGSRLGLWGALGAHGPCTSESLARETGLQERWVREWLFGTAAADLVQHEAGLFALVPEVDVLLNDDSHPGFMRGVFGPPMTHEEVDRTADAFRTGLGMTWAEHGENTCHMQAAMSEALQEAFLVPVFLAALDGASDRLRDGGSVIDIGCGAGVAACALAGAFPRTTVLGLDPSAGAIESARSRASRLGLANVTFERGTFDDLAGQEPCDLLVTLDVLHDLPRPEEAIAAARAAIRDDGWWLVADIRGTGDFERNRKIPVLPYMYCMSVFYCMSSSLSEPGGAGLGTLGLHADLLEEMVTAAGFGRFVVHDHDEDPTNRYYEIRP